MFVSVRLGGGVLPNALLVPERAIGNDQSKRFVFVVGAGNKAEYREVTLGRRRSTATASCCPGLKAGDRVIVDGLQKLAPGAPVAPQAAQSRTAELICIPCARRASQRHESVQILHRPADLRRRDLDRHLPGRPDRDDPAADLANIPKSCRLRSW